MTYRTDVMRLPKSALRRNDSDDGRVPMTSRMTLVMTSTVTYTWTIKLDGESYSLFLFVSVSGWRRLHKVLYYNSPTHIVALIYLLKHIPAPYCYVIK